MPLTFNITVNPNYMKLDRKLYTEFPMFIITAEKHKRMSLYFTTLRSQAATSWNTGIASDQFTWRRTEQEWNV